MGKVETDLCKIIGWKKTSFKNKWRFFSKHFLWIKQRHIPYIHPINKH